jgi:hypothetical protein
MSQGFDEIVNTAEPGIKDLAKRTKALIKKVMPGVVEVAWPAQRIIGYGVGPKKMSEQFCYIALAAHHINLGFYYGADLPDPQHLLEGTGQSLRHVKIRSWEQLDDPALYKLVAAASKHLPKLKP